MKFRTEIEISPLEHRIDHTTRVFSIGSCFAESVAGRLRRYKFRVSSNPTGVLYNPFSIADALEGLTEDVAAAEWVLITFGTAWVYELDGRVVANCGRRPAHLFTRRRLSVDEIVERFDALLGGVLAGRRVVFTLSPVRHLKDGAEENSLSKAILRLAIAELVDRHPDAVYFPAWEIVNDDLRDYRFYGADMAHPSAEAVEYVWEKFAAAALDPCAMKLIPEIENILRATEHRPFNADSQEHNAFRRAMLDRVKAFRAKNPHVDLDAEIRFFS